VIARLRRLRWLPLLLTVLSPAVGGEVLPLLHPCPVEQSWSTGSEAPTAERTAIDDRHAHHAPPASTDEPTEPAHDHDATGGCSCLGSCHTPGVVTAPAAPVVALAVESSLPVVDRWVAVESVSSARLSELLPPKTAPPIA
jgi:hypothetical protein